jgi:hypothetical protein
MTSILFGSSWESFVTAPPAGMQKLAEMGFSFVRLWIFWDSTQPAADQLNWTKVDADIAAIRGTGMKVFANLLWAPKHACGGLPTYLPYTNGCTEWNDPLDGSKGIRFAHERPFCTNPPHIDAVRAREFGAALATRHGNDITWFAAWNEPGGDLYWPAIRTDNRDVAIGRLLDEVTIPFTEGVRSVKPDAQFVGPEADGEGVLDEALQQEAARDLKLFDAITFHPYSWGTFPEDSYKRIDNEFMPATLAHRNRRPVWYSEVGDDGTGRIVEWTQSAVTRDVAAINYHDFKQWFQPGTWDNGTFLPNEKYEAMQTLIARVNRRRRPVLHARAEGQNDAQLRLRDWRKGVLGIRPE